MSKEKKPVKGVIQVATAQLAKIAKRNEATPKGVMAVVAKGLIKAMQPKR